MNREKRLLLGLVCVLLVLGGRALWPRLAGLEDTEGVSGFGFSASEPGPAVPRLAELRLADLERKPGEYHPGRDPFRFAPKPRPAPKPEPAAKPVRARRARTKAPEPRPAGPPAPTPPAVDVTYLGSFGPENGKIAVFADGTDIYNVRKGDILKQHFVVESINYESADLKFVNFPKVPPKRLAAGG